MAQCTMAKRLFEVMMKKKSNLAVAADVKTVADLLSVADKVCTAGLWMIGFQPVLSLLCIPGASHKLVELRHM